MEKHTQKRHIFNDDTLQVVLMFCTAAVFIVVRVILSFFKTLQQLFLSFSFILLL